MDADAYRALLERKAARLRAPRTGIDVAADSLHPALYGFQREIVHRALSRGTCALFEDCGLGKTVQELEWARHVARETGRPVLVVAPLAVGPQFATEGERLDLPVMQARRQADVAGAITVTNYEMLTHFDPRAFGGLVLDESSILKSELGRTRGRLIEFASEIAFRLAATATPAPNDLAEILNHAAYLGRMTVGEAKAIWFSNAGDSTQTFRLKGHAAKSFWSWVSGWAIALRHPADIGMPMDGFDLPPCRIIDHEIEFEGGLDLFGDHETGIAAARRNRRLTLGARVQACAERVNADREAWVVWCELNSESAALAAAIPGAVEVRGSDPIDAKLDALEAFAAGRIRVLVSKPSICGHGLNWQHVARMAFVGAGYSFEQQYQAIRRCWRYGQERAVEVHRYASELDRGIVEAVRQKEEGAMSLFDQIPWQVGPKTFAGPAVTSPTTDVATGPGWTLHLGDSVDTIDEIPDSSVGLAVFSPPFPGMYVYTDSAHDMGNVASIAEMVDQFAFLASKMLRVLMPGRSAFCHITQGVAQLGRDGYIGLRDFRGDLIKMFESAGWRYYGEVTIDKNPQAKAVRTKDQGLMFKSLSADASRMHPALSDMLLQFRKPGENPVPIRAGRSERYGNMEGWVTTEEWIRWARPVWYASDFQPPGSEGVPGIRETDTLNAAAARSAEDERHICPLQLEVIRRCVRVWSNPGEVVYSPFAGIGSEGYVALREGRRFVGGELNRRYWEVAQHNLLEGGGQMSLLSA